MIEHGVCGTDVSGRLRVYVGGPVAQGDIHITSPATFTIVKNIQTVRSWGCEPQGVIPERNC